MKQNFAILAVTALLLCSLTACGGDQNNGAANGNVNGAENGTTSGMTGKTDSGSNVSGELNAPRQLQQSYRHARGADRGLGARYVERAALPSHAGKRPRP